MADHARALDRLTLLADPRLTGAVALLAVNDHVLKGRLPGWFTGKASDVAGVFVVCVVLGVVVRRRDVAAVVTAVAFASLKTSALAGSLAAPLLGGPTLQDRSDVLALVALVPAWRLLRSYRRPREGLGVVTTVLVGASLGTTVLATTATSCLWPPAVQSITVEGSSLVAVVASDLPGYGSEPEWARSDDGGRTWRAIPDRGDAPKPKKGPMSVCVASTCFRIRGSTVERRVGAGGWTLDYARDPRVVARQRPLNGRCNGRPELDDGFRSILIVGRAREQSVLVNMGSQGLLVRSPDGRWQAVRVLGAHPVRTGADPRWRWFVLMPLLFLAGAGIETIRMTARHRGIGAVWVVMVAAGLIMGVVVGVFSFLGLDPSAAGQVIAALTVAVFVVSLLAWRRRGRQRET